MHGTVTAFSRRIAAGGFAMTLAGAVLVVLGTACLLVSGFLMYRMIPRHGQPSAPWMKTESGETAMALGQFILMIAGLAFFAKALL
jgi:hypothetical protein